MGQQQDRDIYSRIRSAHKNKNLEKTVISEMMLEGKGADTTYAFEKLDGMCFTGEHASIFNIMQTVWNTTGEIDFVSVSLAIKDKQMLAALSEVINFSVTSANIKNHVDMLVRLKERRAASWAMVGSLEKMIGDDDDFNDTLQSTIESLSSTQDKIAEKKEFETRDTIRESIQIIQENKTKDFSEIGVEYGLVPVDFKIKHYRKQLHVLGARPSVGKTAFALSCMSEQIRNGRKVLLFCGESDRFELMHRILCIRTNTCYDDMIQGKVNINSIKGAVSELNDMRNNFWIYGLGDYSHSISDIKAVSRRISEKHGQLDMIYADHLHNMSAPPHLAGTKLREQIGYNCREFKLLNNELNTAGVLLVQLNRETGKVPRPTMGNIKESSTVDEEAHIISFLHRDTVSNEKHIEDKTDHLKDTEWYTDKVRTTKDFWTKLVLDTSCGAFKGKYSSEY